MLNVCEGFVCNDICFGKDMKKGLNIVIECNGINLKALVDTGCGPNVMFRNAYDRMVNKNDEIECKGMLKGIGELELPIIARLRDKVKIAGICMEEDDFYVVDGRNEKYDVLLGCQFLKRNRMVIHPEKEMLEVRMGSETSVKLYLEDDGRVNARMVSGVEVYAVENVE